MENSENQNANGNMDSEWLAHESSQEDKNLQESILETLHVISQQRTRLQESMHPQNLSEAKFKRNELECLVKGISRQHSI